MARGREKKDGQEVGKRERESRKRWHNVIGDILEVVKLSIGDAVQNWVWLNEKKKQNDIQK